MADVLVGLVDLVDKLLDRDIVLRSVRQTLVQRLLQSIILGFSILQGLLQTTLLLFESLDAGVLAGQVFPGILQLLCERLVLCLAVRQILLAGTAGHQTNSQSYQKNTFLHT